MTEESNSPWPSIPPSEGAGEAVSLVDTSGRFLITNKPVGEGGHGIIVEGTEIELGRIVAIKILSGIETDITAEAQTLARLEFEAIVPVYAMGQLRDGRRFLAMRLINGETLEKRLNTRNETISRTSKWGDIFAKICGAISVAHANNVTHNDITPQNVMVNQRDEVFVIDWGIAHSATKQDSDMPFGTPGFMAPEQARGNHIGPQIDVFALGGLLAYLFLNESPWQPSKQHGVWGLKPLAAIERDLMETASKLRRMAAGPNAVIHTEFVDLIENCLHVDPGLRPADAGELLVKFESARATVDKRLQHAELELQSEKQKKRNRRILATLLAAVLAIIFFLQRLQLINSDNTLARSLLERGLSKCQAGDPHVGLLFLSRAFSTCYDKELRNHCAEQIAIWRDSTSKLVRALPRPAPWQFQQLSSSTLVVDSNEKKLTLIDARNQVHQFKLKDEGIDTLELMPKSAICMSEDGKTFICCSRKPGESTGPVSVTLVDRNGNQIGHEFEFEGWLDSVALTNNRTFAWAQSITAKNQSLWNVETGKVIWELGSGEPVKCALFNPLGTDFFCVDGSSNCHWIDLVHNRERSEHPFKSDGTNMNFSAASFSPSGSLFALASDNGHVLVYKVYDKGLRLLLEQRIGVEANSLAFDRGGQWLAAGCRDGSVFVLDVERKGIYFVKRLHETDVTDVRFLELNGEFVLISSSRDHTTAVTSIGDGANVGGRLHHCGQVGDVAASVINGHLTLVTSDYGGGKVWRTPSVASEKQFVRQKRCVAPQAFVTGTEEIFSSDHAGETELWNRKSKHVITDFGLRPFGNNVHFSSSSDGRWVLALNGSERVQLLDTWASAETRKFKSIITIKTKEGIECPTKYGELSPCGQFAALAVDKETQLWKIIPPKLIWRTDSGQRQTHGFSPNGDSLGVFSEGNHWIFDVKQGTEIQIPDSTRGVANVVFAPESDRFVVVQSGGRSIMNQQIELWSNLRTNPRQIMTGKHEADVNSVVFGSHCSYFVTCSSDKSARLWDKKTGVPVTPDLLHESKVNVAIFVRNDSLVITGCSDGTIRFWDVRFCSQLGPPIRCGSFVKNLIGFGDEVIVVTGDDVLVCQVPQEPKFHEQNSKIEEFTGLKLNSNYVVEFEK